MKFFIKELSQTPYTIDDVETICAPGLIVFEDRLDYNIQKMSQLLAEAKPGLMLHSLMPHAKTHKSVWVTRKLINAGVHSFKASPNEVEMLLAAGAKSIFVAYPLLKNQAFRLAGLADQYRDIMFFVQASNIIHVEWLMAAANQYDISWHYFIDVDVGMGRTGIAPQDIADFYNQVPQTEYLQFAGIHAYAGHNQSTNPGERQQESRRSMRHIVGIARELEKVCFSIPRIVVGGTPSFLFDLEVLTNAKLDSEIILSPGTWIFFDTKSQALMPDTFQVAALVIAQIIDLSGNGTATLNVGHKRIAIDQGPVDYLSVTGAKPVQCSEEHTVIAPTARQKIRIGDYVLLPPRHVCSTVNLWESFSVINADGKVKIRHCPVDARNR
jgi:D-serine deaminase-like pyridoxal phosphate-dependent protein